MTNKKLSRPNKEEKLPTFTDRFEENLKMLLFSEDMQKTVKKMKEYTEKDNEESPHFEYNRNLEHYKRDGIWDVSIDEEIHYFDPNLSYELTGYRPINMTEGFDFDPKPFCEVGNKQLETGKYTEYKKGSKPYADFWRDELNKCVNGYTVGKYRITGDHYFFLNFYRMKTVSDNKKAGSGRNESFPSFHAKQYEYFHYIEMCEYLYKDCAALKARGVKTCPLL